ncbi:putative transmembrane acyltransferase [Candidatus Phaeomarinobacter ectocarpi]|uniref:Putative transmembrane acyltransferase n=1 Tax=Candidatus Phaeomarinibacter ectocarpi TaxID=1458461 RepID=X5M7G3_9HYPH|nr:acyltransferase [Candidatus Phaeomarinobacter ectocarpi]CDO59088.1 putative transmembrane acyltransferase [Candidatus Phaeomarinobacter ectocarpi]
MLVEALSRKTSGKAVIREIDGLRFFAIMAVLTAHSWGTFVPYSGLTYDLEKFTTIDAVLMRVFLQGKLGVFLFFTISGFVLALPWARHALSGGPSLPIGRFYLKRLTRLEPPYVLCMVGYYIALSAVGRLSYSGDFDNLIASLLYSHNIVYGTGSTIYLAAWSLEVEFQFYVLAPLIFTGLFALGQGARRVTMLACILIWSWAPQTLHGWEWPDTILTYAHYFIAGVLLADVYVSGQLFFGGKSRWFDFLALASFVLILFVFGQIDRNPAAQLGYVAGYAGLFVASFRSLGFRRFVTWVPVVIIGGMCYSIYLLHGRVMTFVTVYLVNGVKLSGSYAVDQLIMIVLLVPLCLAVSAVFFVLIERPTMDSRWPERLRNWFMARARSVGARL